MTARKDKLPIPFRLADIETMQWSVTPENYNEDNPEFGLSFNSGFSVNIENQSITASPKITLSQIEKIFLVIETAFTFLIEDEGWNKMVIDDKFIIPKGLKEHLLVIALGTIRGIIHEKTNSKKSKIDSFILPTIDVRNGTGDDLIFELNEH